jgi:uncharacterized ion transporter superfamily protein YfcC
MADKIADPQTKTTAFKFPTAYTILFALIVVAAAASWIVPAGQYDRVQSVELGQEVPVPGSYKLVKPNPQGVADVFLAPIGGFYDSETGTARAVDVALFVLIIGGFLGVVNSTGAIEKGISRAMQRLRGREILMIPILMALFAVGGTTIGMAEETLAFYALLIPVLIAAGYDAVVAVAVILLGAGIGVLGSTINPFATVIASNAAGIPFTDGLELRVILLVLGWLACVAYVMRYASRVKKDPAKSILAKAGSQIDSPFLGEPAAADDKNLSVSQIAVLGIFILTFAVMIWGVSTQGWWMDKMSALFLFAAILVALVTWMGEQKFTGSFVDGARDLLGVALIIGIARGIVVVMDAGKITDTILFAGEGLLNGLSPVGFVNVVFGIELVLSFFVPSSSGLAVLTMPIMAPLADFSQVDRSLVVTAYQSANGLVNLINPTFAVVMGALAIGGIPYNRWLVFMWPLLLLLALLIIGGLSIAAMTA